MIQHGYTGDLTAWERRCCDNVIRFKQSAFRVLTNLQSWNRFVLRRVQQHRSRFCKTSQAIDVAIGDRIDRVHRHVQMSAKRALSKASTSCGGLGSPAVERKPRHVMFAVGINDKHRSRMPRPADVDRDLSPDCLTIHAAYLR